MRLGLLIRKLTPLLAVSALAWVGLSCGGGGDAGAVTIDGGIITSDDASVTLEFPPGAVDESTDVTITAVSLSDRPDELREATGP